MILNVETAGFSRALIYRNLTGISLITLHACRKTCHMRLLKSTQVLTGMLHDSFSGSSNGLLSNGRSREPVAGLWSRNGDMTATRRALSFRGIVTVTEQLRPGSCGSCPGCNRFSVPVIIFQVLLSSPPSGRICGFCPAFEMLRIYSSGAAYMSPVKASGACISVS